tara:strand:+ start:354 stop:1022 length:669 start_codon:yes stop_codon:yes gene_type:complete
MEELHANARALLDGEQWIEAINLYKRLERDYPYSKYAVQSQMELVYAYYQNSEPELAISLASDLIRTHPTHPHIDYAYYIRALSIFNASTSMLDIISPSDPSKFDTEPAKKSFEAFNELVTLFPTSDYADDSTNRMAELLNILARQEINIAVFYLQQGSYIAALNRARFVVEEYPETTETEPALAVMIAAYQALNLEELSKDARRVLENSYPNSIYISKDTD